MPSARKFEEQMRAKQGKPIDIIPTSTANISTPSKRPAVSANVPISSSKLDGGGGGPGGGGGGAGGVVAVVGGPTRQSEQLPDDDDFDEDKLNDIASKGCVETASVLKDIVFVSTLLERQPFTSFFVCRLSPIPVVITMDADDVEEPDDGSPGDDLLDDDDSGEDAKAEDVPSTTVGQSSSRGVNVRRQRRSGGRSGFPSKPRSKVKYAYSL